MLSTLVLAVVVRRDRKAFVYALLSNGETHRRKVVLSVHAELGQSGDKSPHSRETPASKQSNCLLGLSRLRRRLFEAQGVSLEVDRHSIIFQEVQPDKAFDSEAGRLHAAQVQLAGNQL